MLRSSYVPRRTNVRWKKFLTPKLYRGDCASATACSSNNINNNKQCNVIMDLVWSLYLDVKMKKFM